MKLVAKIIDNESNEVVEQSDFSGLNANAELNEWKAKREAIEQYGAGQKRRMTIEDQTAQDDIEKKILSRAEVRAGCLKVVDKISAINTDSGASDETMDSLFSQTEMVAVILALLTGAPGTAKRKIQVVGPALYPQTVVDDIVADLSALE